MNYKEEDKLVEELEIQFKEEIDQDYLENLIDNFGLWKILESLSNICYEKAEHLGSNWRDGLTATEWESAARQLDKIDIPT